jgi:hypothetical protein
MGMTRIEKFGKNKSFLCTSDKIVTNTADMLWVPKVSLDLGS